MTAIMEKPAKKPIGRPRTAVKEIRIRLHVQATVPQAESLRAVSERRGEPGSRLLWEAWRAYCEQHHPDLAPKTGSSGADRGTPAPDGPAGDRGV